MNGYGKNISLFELSLTSWYRELCPKLKDPDWQPGPALITTKIRTTPNILRLTWGGYPLYYHEKHGWGYLIPEEQYGKPS